MARSKTERISTADAMARVEDLAKTWPQGAREVLDKSSMPTVFHDPDDDLIALSSRQFTSVSLEGEDTPSSRDVPRPSASVAGGPLPEGSPEWMRIARALSTALERMIAQGSIDDWERARIERTALAFGLVGVTKRRMRSLAHLLRRAHLAIRNTQRDVIETAYRDCAEVVYGAMPHELRRTTPFDTVATVVRELREQADPWLAVVDGTCKLLGWSDYARAHAAQALRIAIMEGDDTGG